MVQTLQRIILEARLVFPARNYYSVREESMNLDVDIELINVYHLLYMCVYIDTYLYILRYIYIYLRMGKTAYICLRSLSKTREVCNNSFYLL